MDIILLGITIVSLGVALVMSIAAWRVTRDEKKRAAARVAALSLAANGDDKSSTFAQSATAAKKGLSPQEGSAAPQENPWSSQGLARPQQQSVRVSAKAPWARAPFAAVPADNADSLNAVDMPLNQPRAESLARAGSPAEFEPSVSHAAGFLGVEAAQRDTGSRQKSLAFAAVLLFVVLSGGLVWMMSAPRGTTAAAVGPNAPLELVSLSHQRENNKLAVSGLVRNPSAGQPIERLSAVVFLFDRMGTFVTSSRANVDFLKLGAGDESPFVVSLDAPPTVARYRVSFRTEDGVMPHIDRRGETGTAGSQESTVKSQVVSQQ